jgi:hypothetical protein
MHKKVKTALLFSGKLGDWKECSKYIAENLLNVLEPDIFLSTWKGEHTQDFNRFYNPVVSECIDFEKTMKLLKPNDLAYQPNAGLIPMLAGMKCVHSLYREYEEINQKKYDLIIRIRPDVQVLETIDKKQIEECIKLKYITLPLFESDNIYNHEEEMKKEFSFSFVYDKASLPNQVNDQFAVGHPNEMDKYMNSILRVGEAIEKLWNEGYPEYMIKVPESVITTCLNLQGCKYKQLKGTNSFGNIKTILCKNGKKWRNQGHHSTELNKI